MNLEIAIDSLREDLNYLVEASDNNLYEGEILNVSEKLDELIIEYYNGAE